MWREAEQLVKATTTGVTFADIYALWRAPPFGIRDGLLPILAAAFLLTSLDHGAIYLEEVFRPQLDSFLIDRLLQDPSAVRVRWVELSDLDTTLIAELSKRLTEDGHCVPPSPLEVAKALVRQVLNLPNWTMRTASLSQGAATLRQLGRSSHDPNQLLFEDLPRAFAELGAAGGVALAAGVNRARQELEGAYSAMLYDMVGTLYRELRCKVAAAGDFGPLQRRAVTVKGLSGNFRLDALATRLTSFEGSIEEVEGIASLAANKPSRDWVDRDIDAARIELAALAQQFLRAEGFAHLKGRADGRVTMVVYMSDPAFPAPISPEIELDVIEHQQADALASKFAQLLEREGTSNNVAIGALAKLGMNLIHLSASDPGAP